MMLTVGLFRNVKDLVGELDFSFHIISQSDIGEKEE